MRTWSLGRPLIAIVALAALGAGVAFAAVNKHHHGGEPIRLTVETNAPGRTIPSGFVGLSTEYWAIPSYAGHDPEALDPVFEQLIRNLAPGARPVLRLGGDSTDWTWWPVPGLRKPPGNQVHADREVDADHEGADRRDQRAAGARDQPRGR